MLMPENDSISYLIGGATVSNFPRTPYDDLYCDFLNDISSELRSNQESAAYSDVMAFAFWCRKANIAKLKTDFDDERTRLGLGIVFHITPSNVPVNFAFSFAFGLLSGNANVVRVPSKQFPQIDVICSAINQVCECEKYFEIKEMTAFVRYGQSDEITGEFSAGCNARVIWGGDETIKNIRRLPLPERGVEVVFSDRYSFCVLEASCIEALDKKSLKRLAESFFNDAYVMDQNACTSPHLIVWLGEKNEFAKENFWEAVSQVVSKKYQLANIQAVDKYTKFCHDIIEIEGIISVIRHGSHVYRVELSEVPSKIDELRGMFGYFYEYDTEAIEDLTHFITNKFQTLTYFGIDNMRLLNYVVNNQLLGIDRIVPVGQAHDIGVFWDGYDIVKSLSRVIDVK